jgi:hypothetical protein
MYFTDFIDEVGVLDCDIVVFEEVCVVGSFQITRSRS